MIIFITFFVSTISRKDHKGKPEKNETWERAALREVKEETGYKAEILSFAGTNHYHKKDRVKVALFWNMEAKGECLFQPSKEVERIEWLPYEQALERFTFPGDKDLVLRALNELHKVNL